MVTVFITIEVSNFLEWKKIFDKNEKIRRGLNIFVKEMYLSIDDADFVTVIAEAESRESFHHFFFNDKGVKSAIDKYGFKSPPQVKYYNKIFK
jgi:hypothetical protein